MKKLKTPILTINGTDYTKDIKGLQITSGNIFTTLEKVLPNSNISGIIRRPYKKIHGYTDISNPNNLIVNGVLYNSSLSVVLENVTASNGIFYISNGGLYQNGSPIENEDSGWTDLSNQGTNYGTFLGIKNGSLYMLCYETREVTPQVTITKDLYCWSYEEEIEQADEETGEVTTDIRTYNIYTEVENPQIGDILYSTYLTELGTITEMESGITYNEHLYERNTEGDTTGTKTIPAEYKTALWIDLLDDTRTYVEVCGNCGHNASLTMGTNGYVRTSGNQLYKVDWKTYALSLSYSNITKVYKSPKQNKSFIIQSNNGTFRYIGFESTSTDATYTGKLDSDVQFISPEGYWGAAYIGNTVCIKDGNLYKAWGSICNEDGHWSKISTGYECGYGICDGKLYKLYGTDSSWYNKQIDEIKLLDKTAIWVDLYCDYSSAYALTSDGRLYYIKDEKLTLKKTGIPLGVNYTEVFSPQVISFAVGDTDTTKHVTISKELLDTLLEDAQP